MGRLAAPRRSRWKSQKLEWTRRQIEEREKKGEDFVFSGFPKKMKVGLRYLRGWDVFLLLFREEGVLEGGMAWSTRVWGLFRRGRVWHMCGYTFSPWPRSLHLCPLTQPAPSLLSYPHLHQLFSSKESGRNEG